MRRKFWIAFGILFILTLVSGYFYLRSIYFFPDSDVAVTNHIGWWPYQEHVSINSFDYQVVEVRFGLFNTGEALIRFNIQGEVRSEYNKSRPYIEKVHISERYTRNDDSPTANLEITPIVDTEDDAAYKKEPIPFEVNVEYIVRAYQWGDNKYLFQCSDITRELTLQQLK